MSRASVCYGGTKQRARPTQSSVRYQHVPRDRDRAIAGMDVILRGLQESDARSTRDDRMGQTSRPFRHLSEMASELDLDMVSEGGLSHVRHARRSGIWPLEQDFFLRSSGRRRRRAASSRRFPTPTRSSSTPAPLVDLVAQPLPSGERSHELGRPSLPRGDRLDPRL